MVVVCNRDPTKNLIVKTPPIECTINIVLKNIATRINKKFIINHGSGL